jgi:hypothetical protein
VRALAVAALEHGDLSIVLVGEDRLEAVAVVVVRRPLRAGVWSLGSHDQPEALGPGGQIDAVVISQTSPFSRSEPFWSSAATQASAGICRIAARTGSVSS